MSGGNNHSIPTDSQRNKQQNTDNILKSFDKWHCSFQSLVRQRNELQDDLQSTHQEKQQLTDSNHSVKNELDMLHKTLKSCNSQLNRLCVLEDENRHLKCRSEEKDAEVDDMRKHLSEERSNHTHILKQTKEELESQHAKEMNAMKMEATLELEKLHKLVQDRGRDIEQLEVKVTQLQTSKDTELSRLSLEYENKFIRLQRQKSQASSNQGSFANNEIFRKKLQNLRTEHEVEMDVLRRTNASLEDKLVQATQAPVYSRLQLGKRKRPA